MLTASGGLAHGPGVRNPPSWLSRLWGPEARSISHERAVFGHGDSVASELQRLGLDHQQIYQASRSLEPLLDLRRIPNGLPYQVHRSADGSVQFLTFPATGMDIIVLDLRDPISAWREMIPHHLGERVIHGRIQQTLSQLMATKNAPDGLTNRTCQLFGSRVDFKKLTPKDQVTVLFREQRALTGQARLVRILAARLTHRDRSYEVFYHEADGKAGYFDARGDHFLNGFLPAPVAESYLSSPYSKSRYHPILKRHTAHLGTDYAAPYGTPVLAVGNGTVTHATHHRYNGNYVKIRHNAVYSTQYLHMSKLEPLEPGDYVKRGQVIGYVGNTGLADGTHVCFRLWKDGVQVDPKRHRPAIETAEQAGPGFSESRMRLRALLDQASQANTDLSARRLIEPRKRGDRVTRTQ